MIINYYFLSRPHMSFIIEDNSFCLHKLHCPTHPVFILAWVKVTLVVAVRSRVSYRCTILAIWVVFPPVHGTSAVTAPPFFLRALICSVSHFISSCCRVTVSTDTARLADNSARGVPVASVCVAATAMLSR